MPMKRPNGAVVLIIYSSNDIVGCGGEIMGFLSVGLTNGYGVSLVWSNA